MHEQRAKLNQKEEAYRRWKQNQVTQDECRDTVSACRDQFRKDKVHLELNLARYVKRNRKKFYRYLSSKNKARINVGLLLNVARNLVSKDMQKTGILNVFSIFVFTCMNYLNVSQGPMSRGKVQNKEYLLPVKEDQVREHLNKSGIHKPMGCNSLHL